MMGCTDRHARYLLRLASRRTRLYTEMVTASAVLQGDAGRLLAHHPDERPLAVQLGGAEPLALAAASRIAAAHGFDEVNLNVGCPSARVRNGRFGACLMAEPERVADCVRAMGEAVRVPVTVKTRIGIDDRDRYRDLAHFVATVAAAGCRIFIVHARKAWLEGLSPKQNRELPPLRYPLVRRLKRDFPELAIVLNGGVATLEGARAQLGRVDGVMIGRAAYRDPYLLARADRLIFGDRGPIPTRHELLERYRPYLARELARGTPLARMTRHLVGLFQGTPGSRAWRRVLSERAHRPGAGLEVVDAAARHVREQTPEAWRLSA